MQSQAYKHMVCSFLPKLSLGDSWREEKNQDHKKIGIFLLLFFVLLATHVLTVEKSQATVAGIFWGFGGKRLVLPMKKSSRAGITEKSLISIRKAVNT